MIKIDFLADWAPRPSNDVNSLLQLFEDDLNYLKKIIRKIMQIVDARDYFYSIFQAMNYAGVSPFIATHDYCIKVKRCKEEDTVETNISPIYHLGLEYPDHYKIKHGKHLDKTAIVGLIEKPVAGTLPPGHTCYSYGVDAGILFQNSSIPHNKTLDLKLQKIPEGILASLSCDTQTSSLTISWKEIEIDSLDITKKEKNRAKTLPAEDWAKN